MGRFREIAKIVTRNAKNVKKIGKKVTIIAKKVSKSNKVVQKSNKLGLARVGDVVEIDTIALLNI